MKKIYIAMAEMEDGNRIFERAYSSREAAEKAVTTMILDIEENTDWKVVPAIEEIEFVED